MASDASRFEATDTLKLNAGRDVLNVGSDLKAGGNASVTAGRDVVIASQTEQDDYAYQRRRVKGTEQTTLQYGSNVDVGGNLAIDARRDIAVVASTVSAAKDLSVKAGENLTLAAAANEQHDYSKGKKGGTKTTTQLDTVTQQSAELKAGGDLIAIAGTDLTLVASKISAGNEAYVHADNELSLLAAQDSNYSLYDMSKKGGWGSKKTQRDEVTQVTNVGSEIKTGGDLTLQSGGDQKYQAAKLDSGGDIAIVSGGAVTFEAVKDLHDESHTKSKGDLAWTSSKGKGNTDETLRQTQMVAEGNVVIKAVDGLKIDIKQIDQNTVSQTIDAMVKADPQLAWLKEAEKRGDVDWRQVKELHESFKYSNSGLGAGAQIIIAIIVTYFTMGAASGAIAAAGTGTSMAGATAAATATSAAGWANAAGSVVLGGMASNGAISTINNRGNLGAVLKDVTSSDAMRGYVVSGVTAGLTAGVYDKWTSTQTGTSTALPNTGAVATTSPLSTWQGVGQFTANQALQNGTSVLVDRALGGEARLGEALQNSLANAFAAYGFNLVGDVSKGRFTEGGITKIGLHALMGGLAAEASGGDFRTGALAAGVTEALVDSLAKNYADMPDDQKKGLLVMNSQLIGVLAASVLDGADAKSLQTGAWVAGTATQYNFLNHQDVKDLETALWGCKEKRNCDAVREEFRLRDAANSARLAACTTDCAAIRSELDAGSPALKRLWESDTTGITDEFLRNNINEWSSAGPRVANQVAEAAWRGDSTSLQQLGQFLDQQGFNPFGINASGLIGFGGGAKTGTNGAADSTTSPGRVSGGETVGKVEIHPPEQASAKGTDTGKAPYTSIVSTDAEAGMPYSHPVKEAGTKATAPKVTAEGKIDGQAFTDVNQTARPGSQAKIDQPTLIADRVNTKIDSSGKPLPNANMATAHAEIGVIQQAYNAGKTEGAAMTLKVEGQAVCGYCRGDIAAAAEKAGLKSLEINEVATGKTLYWRPGMRSIKELD
ncbi:UNVERIFIED_ORG: hypothetical protein J3D59_002601 [Pseudomonas fluorescens]